MASWQAYLTAWILRRRLKPRLARAKDIPHTRKLMTPVPSKIPRDVRVTQAVIGGVRGEWVEGSHDSEGTLLYLHGGGYFAMSPETHRPITCAFARQGFRVFAPDYRLAPENPFPAAVDDAVASYHGLLSGGASERNLLVAGDSAGGGLSLSLLLSLRDAAIPLPAACVLFSPWTDLAATGDSIRTNDRRCALFFGEGIASAAHYYLGDTDAKNPLASPLYADLSGLPPLLIHVGENEVLRDDSTRLAERARAAGTSVTVKVWPVVPHDWQLVPMIPEARQSLNDAGAFMRRAIAERSTAPASAAK
jgi:monoterpene epsilon-lactone hydrolase